MSRADEGGEQPTLRESIENASQRARSEATAQGARYGRAERRDESHNADDPEAATQVCRNCEASIDGLVARVVGDEHGCVPVCRACVRSTNGRSFDTTAKAARQYRTDRQGVIVEDER